MKISTSATTAIETEESITERTRHALVRIVSYLRTHPTARDTARWIAQFWAKASLEAAEAALRFLTAKGALRATHSNGDVLYSRNPDFPWTDLQRLVREFTRPD